MTAQSIDVHRRIGYVPQDIVYPTSPGGRTCASSPSSTAWAGPRLPRPRSSHVNTLLLQAVLDDPGFRDLVDDNDRRGLSPLFWTHINPHGRFDLDMDTQLDLDRP